MKKSLALGLGTCLLLFALCEGLGYAALGDGVSGNLLLAFQDNAPAWVIILGSLMVVLSMVPAYQVRACSCAGYASVSSTVLGAWAVATSCICSSNAM